MRQIARSALLAALIAFAPAARASVQVEGVRFPGLVEAGDAGLRLHGGALLKWFLFKVYVAALYLPEGVPAERALEDVPKRLEFTYLVDIAGKDFGPAGEKILRQNVPEEEMESLRGRLDRIGAAYRDIDPGDRYALTYLPGRGTELSMNGEPLAFIEGADFARAYFSIWLGERPLDRGFKRDLLRGLGPEMASSR